MSARLRQLIAEASDSLTCAEVLSMRMQGPTRNANEELRRMRALRSDEINRAARYIQTAKDELKVLLRNADLRVERRTRANAPGKRR